MKVMTKKQSEIYEYVRSCIVDKRYSPSKREIAKKFSLKSTGTVEYYVRVLIKKGWLVRDENRLLNIRGFN